MGTISSPQAFYGLKAIGTPTKTQVANDAAIGVSNQTVNLTGATKGYCVSATLASATDILTINTETGIATVGTAPVSQVETATVVAASGATSSGSLAVTVTAAGVTGSPLSIPVALVTGVDTTASLIAAKVRAALGANAALTALYTVGGTGANITLTRTVAANNDATLNIAWAAALGVSALTTSTDTTAGVGGVVLTNNTGDGKDFEGVSLGTMTALYGVLIKCVAGSIYAEDGNTTTNLNAGGFLLVGCAETSLGATGNTTSIEANSDGCQIEITFFSA